MKRLFIIVVSILLLMILPSPLKAQVTIGSGNPPSKGVLLDLKEIDDAIAIAGGRTASKGIIFPRVALVSSTSLDGVTDADATTPGRYKGLTVYNITNNASVSEGVHIWDGTKWVSAQSQPQSQLKSFLNVRGTGSIVPSATSIPGLTNWYKIPFPTKVIDENNEYNNTSTYEFTPQQAGIYSIYAQYKISGTLNAGNYSIGIIKKNADNSYTLLAEETYSLISVAGLVVGSPVRSIETLVKLEIGEAITIGTNNSGISLLGSTNSYFTVHQVR